MSNLICFKKDNFYKSIVFLFGITLIFVIFFPENRNLYFNKINKLNERYSNKEIKNRKKKKKYRKK